MSLTISWPGGQTAPRRNPTLKLLGVGLLALILLIPFGLVGTLVADRISWKDEAAWDIARAWGTSQTVTGPLLVAPAGDREPARVITPDTLHVKATLAPEIRARGPIEVVVYTAEIEMTAAFDPDRLPPGADLGGTAARVVVGVSESQRIQPDPEVTVGGRALPVAPHVADAHDAVPDVGLAGSIPSEVLRGLRASEPVTVTVRFRVAGSDQVRVTPLAGSTTIDVSSPWPSPSFFGAHLPAEHAIGDDGFQATWRIAAFGRPFPETWPLAAEHNDDTAAREHYADAAQLMRSHAADLRSAMEHAAVGVRLLQPVDAHAQTVRSLKYGVLFLVLTLGSLFLFEMLVGVRVHLVQYGLVGLSLALFHLLLVAMAEVIGFAPAYGLSTAMVVGQCGLYARSVLGETRRAALFAGLLVILYGVLYVLLRSEDHALMLGALGLFAMLSAVMALSRRIDWSGSGASPSTTTEAPAEG